MQTLENGDGFYAHHTALNKVIFIVMATRMIRMISRDAREREGNKIIHLIRHWGDPLT